MDNFTEKNFTKKMKDNKKRNKKFILIYILIILIIIFFSVNAVAEPIIDLELDIFKNDIVNEHFVSLTDGILSEYYGEEGDYALKILDVSNNEIFSQTFDISFDYRGAAVLGIDYSEWASDRVFVYYKIPYNPSMHELRLYHGNKLIFSKILNFCNSNGVCDSSETFESCLADCPLNSNDVICLPESDGVCDPDCGQGVDPDCVQEFYPNAGEDKEVFFKEPVSFHGEVTNPGSGSYSYEWFFEDDGSTVVGQDATHVFDETGVYAVNLKVTNLAGVSKEDTLLVTVSGLGCRVTGSICDGVTVFKMASLTNSHAQLSGNYLYSVCCSDVPGLSTDSSGAVVLGFAREDDSHVQKSSIGTYPYKAYLSAPGGITCGYVENSGDGFVACEGAGFDTCLASIQSSDNSHVGDCSAYNVKVCCKVGQEGGGFWSWLGFSWFIDYFDKIL